MGGIEELTLRIKELTLLLKKAKENHRETRKATLQLEAEHPGFIQEYDQAYYDDQCICRYKQGCDNVWHCKSLYLFYFPSASHQLIL